MIKFKYILCIGIAVLSVNAIADHVVLFTKTNGDKIVANVADSEACEARLTYLANDRGAIIKAFIPLSKIRSIANDGKNIWVVRSHHDEVASLNGIGTHLSFLLPDGVCAPQLDRLSIKEGHLTRGEDLLLGFIQRNVSRLDIFPSRIAYEDEAKRLELLQIAKREAEEREAKLRQIAEREAEEREAKFRRARELEEREYTVQFRKKLKVGDETHCGMVIERKDPIIKIQSIAGERWLKISQIYPPELRSCRFHNGQYVD